MGGEESGRCFEVSEMLMVLEAWAMSFMRFCFCLETLKFSVLPPTSKVGFTAALVGDLDSNTTSILFLAMTVFGRGRISPVWGLSFAGFVCSKRERGGEYESVVSPTLFLSFLFMMN